MLTQAHLILAQAKKEIKLLISNWINNAGGVHGRHDDPKDSTTNKQLEDDNGINSKGNDPDQITEKQLGEKSKFGNQEAEIRQDDPRDVVTQKQLDEYRTENPLDVTTEKQLSNGNAPWDRNAGSSVTYKTAGDHMSEVLNVLADTAIATGYTPEEVCRLAGSLVSSTSGRVALAASFKEELKGTESVNYQSRLAFWSGRNLKVASVDKSQVQLTLVDGLKVLASDDAINSDLIIDAIDVAADGETGVAGVSKVIDQKLEASAEQEVEVSTKDELRAALADTVSTKTDAEQREEERQEVLASVESEDQSETRDEERKEWEAQANADTMIEVSFEEMGVEASAQDAELRTAIKSFARASCLANNIKLAAITNVTIDGSTISIAVQTEEGDESVEIPLATDEGMTPPMDDLAPEGDIAGEGAGNLGAPMGDPLAQPLASSNDKQTRQAQFGGDGGQDQGAPDGQALPTEAPAAAGQGGVQALTNEGEGDLLGDEIPTAGEKQPAYAICPECGDSDTDISKEADGGIKGDCQACGAKYEALVKKNIEFTIINPAGENGAEPEIPEIPALPVAAQTKIDSGSIKRIANNLSNHGHVCPACGMDGL